MNTLWKPDRDAKTARAEEWAQDMADEAEELRQKILPLLRAALPIARRLEALDACGPSHQRDPVVVKLCFANRWRYACAEELEAILDDWVSGDPEPCRDRDIEHFKAEYEE